jgi:hypothetical protein
MTHGALWTRDDITDIDCACELLVAASRRIGPYDPMAQDMVENALQLIRDMTGNGPLAVLFTSEPPTSSRH